MSAAMTPQLVADVLIVAMPGSGVSFVHHRSFEERGSSGRYCHRPSFSSALANAIVPRSNLRISADPIWNCWILIAEVD
jgi:hypothetical protein